MTNKVRDAFDHIQANKNLKESTKKFLSGKRRKRRWDVYSLAFQRIFAVVCMVLVAAAGIKGYSWVQTPVSYVSIDINPSIELELNRFDKVVTVTAYNEEAEEILNGLSLKGRKYTDALQIIVDSKGMQNYLTEDSELYITVAADSDYKCKIEAGVEHYCGHIGHNAKSIRADVELVSEAHSKGLSLGKYYAYLQLMQYDDSVTVDHCKEMSISEIHGLIDEHQHDGKHGNHSKNQDAAESSHCDAEMPADGKKHHHKNHRDRKP